MYNCVDNSHILIFTCKVDDNARTAGGNFGKVRSDEAEISQRTGQKPLKRNGRYRSRPFDRQAYRTASSRRPVPHQRGGTRNDDNSTVSDGAKTVSGRRWGVLKYRRSSRLFSHGHNLIPHVFTVMQRASGIQGALHCLCIGGTIHAAGGSGSAAACSVGVRRNAYESEKQQG